MSNERDTPQLVALLLPEEMSEPQPFNDTAKAIIAAGVADSAPIAQQMQDLQTKRVQEMVLELAPLDQQLRAISQRITQGLRQAQPELTDPQVLYHITPDGECFSILKRRGERPN